MEFIQQYHIVIIGCLFLIILGSMTWLTWKEKQWVRKNYNKQDIIALGFGITCFGIASKPGGPEKHKGFLLIHKGGLLFKSRFSGPSFHIPGKSIEKVYHGNSHKGARLYQSAVMVDFLTPGKITDTIAFKLAYPPQWIKIMEKTFQEGNA